MSNEKPMQPRMPEEGKRPFVVLNNIKAELMFDSARYSSGSIGMGIDSVTLSRGDEVVGEVEFCLGCGVIIRDKINKRDYGFSAKDLYTAFCGAQEVLPT